MFPLSVGLLYLLHASRVASSPVSQAGIVNETTCNGQNYQYEALAGWGILASDARDKFGDTIGGIGSSVALDKKAWKKKKGNSEAYEGILYGLPDRGWNTNGTQNTQSRIHKFSVSFKIVNATIDDPAGPNFDLTYLDTILLTGPDGTPTTGILQQCTDADLMLTFLQVSMLTQPGIYHSKVSQIFLLRRTLEMKRHVR